MKVYITKGQSLFSWKPNVVDQTSPLFNVNGNRGNQTNSSLSFCCPALFYIWPSHTGSYSRTQMSLSHRQKHCRSVSKHVWAGPFPWSVTEPWLWVKFTSSCLLRKKPDGNCLNKIYGLMVTCVAWRACGVFVDISHTLTAVSVLHVSLDTWQSQNHTLWMLNLATTVNSACFSRISQVWFRYAEMFSSGNAVIHTVLLEVV